MGKFLDTKIGKFSLIGLVALIPLSSMGLWGSRGSKKVYEFAYNGKSAAIVVEDIRFGADKYHLLLNKRDKLHGTVTSDTGEVIEVQEIGYTIGETPK